MIDKIYETLFDFIIGFFQAVFLLGFLVAALCLLTIVLGMVFELATGIDIVHRFIWPIFGSK